MHSCAGGGGSILEIEPPSNRAPPSCSLVPLLESSPSIPSISIEIEPSILGIDRIDFDRIDIESIIDIVPYRFRYRSGGWGAISVAGDL